MQGEPKRRISVISEEIKDLFRHANTETWANKLVDFIKNRNTLIVTYAGSFSSPAKYLALALRNLTEKEVSIFWPQELTYYIAPYDEGREAGIIVFTSPDGISSLNILLDQLRWTGHDVLIISSVSIPKVMKHKVSDEKFIDLTQYTSDWLLLTHVIIGRAVAQFLQMKGIRGERLWKELTDLEPAVNDLLDYYSSEILRAKDFISQPHIMTTSPTMWCVGEYLAFSRVISTPRYLVKPSEIRNYIRHINRIFMVTTDVEEFSMKEVKGLALTAATKIYELRLRTDPLTAPIYGLILAKAIEGIW
jgi:hypothetical protein